MSENKHLVEDPELAHEMANAAAPEMDNALSARRSAKFAQENLDTYDQENAHAKRELRSPMAILPGVFVVNALTLAGNSVSAAYAKSDLRHARAQEADARAKADAAMAEVEASDDQRQ